MRRVSIIVPAFNQARYLRQAVESALDQTYANIEVVIIDDGSTDATPEICRVMAARPNVVVIRQNNRGVGTARNRGAAAAIGDYLCFLDADDFYHPEKIAAQARLLDRSPDLDWVYCDIVTLDESGKEQDEGYSVAGARRQLTGDILESLLVGGFFPPHTVMMRRQAFEALGGFDPALGGNADLDLWLRMAASGRRIEFVNQKLAFYRAHPGGMSRDLAHMRSTRIAALTKLARRYPERTGIAISALQDLHDDLHQGNQWLNEELGRIVNTMTSQATPQAADVTINGSFDRALVEAQRLGVVDYRLEPWPAMELADPVARAVEWAAPVRASRRPPAEREERARLTEAIGRRLVAAEVASSLALDACIGELYGDDASALGHVRRVAAVSQMLCAALKIGEPLLGHIWRAALVKDLGALAIQDAVAPRLVVAFDEATTIGLQLGFAVDALFRVPWLRPAADIVLATREHFDGSGVPGGLSGASIPIGARVIAVATAFDCAGVQAANTPSDSLDRANAELVRYAGSRLDPAIVTAWLEYVDRPGTETSS